MVVTVFPVSGMVWATMNFGEREGSAFGGRSSAVLTIVP